MARFLGGLVGSFAGAFALFAALCAPAAAKKLEISAQNFSGQKSTGLGVFSGDVRLRSGEDFLHCKKLTVRAGGGADGAGGADGGAGGAGAGKSGGGGKSGQILYYDAADVSAFRFEIAGKIYQGSARQISFDAAAKSYELAGNVRIKEGERELLAEEVKIDAASGNYELGGSLSKPVRLVFDLATDKSADSADSSTAAAKPADSAASADKSTDDATDTAQNPTAKEHSE